MRGPLLCAALLLSALCPVAATRASSPSPGAAAWAWSPLSSVHAPSPRRYASVVWTGRELLVWGGLAMGSSRLLNSGARYDPRTDTWTPMTAVGAPSPRLDATAVWTGTALIVWGGSTAPDPDFPQRRDDGAIYTPATDTWRPMSTVRAPSPRVPGAAIWTGSEMLVWAGARAQDRYDTTYYHDGARYDPRTDTWTPLPTAGAPGFQVSYETAWTGRDFLVWGAFVGGARYAPATNTWTPLPTAHAPDNQHVYTTVWTGDDWYFLGAGVIPPATTGTMTGYRYHPASDTWTPLPALPLAGESLAGDDGAYWDGSEVLLWSRGAFTDERHPFTSMRRFGLRYLPATNTWLPMATAGEPGPGNARPVWTGTDLLTLGGIPYANFAGQASLPPLPVGARYATATDTWSLLPSLYAPALQYTDTLRWTGRELLVWSGDTATGARLGPPPWPVPALPHAGAGGAAPNANRQPSGVRSVAERGGGMWARRHGPDGRTIFPAPDVPDRSCPYAGDLASSAVAAPAIGRDTSAPDRMASAARATDTSRGNDVTDQRHGERPGASRRGPAWRGAGPPGDQSAGYAVHRRVLSSVTRRAAKRID